MNDDDGLAYVCTELGGLLDDLGAMEVRNGKAYAGIMTVDHLLADPDIKPAARNISYHGSRPPWNAEVADAILSAHEVIRRLEASLRVAVNGHPGKPRGGSDANTKAALKAIRNLAAAIPYEVRDEYGKLAWPCQRLAERVLARAAQRIGQLTAVDTTVRWEKIRRGPGGLPPQCPNCQMYSLRVAFASGAVICVYPGRDGQGCLDLDGKPAQGRLEISSLTGDPILAWRDGTVQAAPPESHVQAIEPEPEPVAIP